MYTNSSGVLLTFSVVCPDDSLGLIPLAPMTSPLSKVHLWLIRATAGGYRIKRDHVIALFTQMLRVNEQGDH